ncbi:hypothetical protein [Sutcliffiella deserti]|uniref:hypothetical protein n=1 Tax=Sutcliffiella deserti TaxID=2875501 RepID=UPI001CBE79EF|nr:hypothetical protein [Sutcliffiella deserti]
MGCCRNNVAGIDKDYDRVAGIFDENFRVPVHASIDGRDFCQAVRRCLINDLVAGAQDDRRRKCHRRSWI